MVGVIQVHQVEILVVILQVFIANVIVSRRSRRTSRSSVYSQGATIRVSWSDLGWLWEWWCGLLRCSPAICDHVTCGCGVCSFRCLPCHQIRGAASMESRDTECASAGIAVEAAEGITEQIRVGATAM